MTYMDHVKHRNCSYSLQFGIDWQIFHFMVKYYRFKDVQL